MGMNRLLAHRAGTEREWIGEFPYESSAAGVYTPVTSSTGARQMPEPPKPPVITPMMDEGPDRDLWVAALNPKTGKPIRLPDDDEE